MGLKQQQDLLARLYTDAAVRERFRNEAAAEAAKFGLSDTEADDLSEIAFIEVDRFADSLFSKRLREVKKLLPVSAWILGDRLVPVFREFSAGFSSRAVKKHLEEALAFASWVAAGSRTNTYVAAVVKFESARLRHHATDRRLTVCYLTHDVRPLFDYGREGAEVEMQPRRSIAIWLRLGGQMRYIFV